MNKDYTVEEIKGLIKTKEEELVELSDKGEKLLNEVKELETLLAEKEAVQ